MITKRALIKYSFVLFLLSLMILFFIDLPDEKINSVETAVKNTKKKTSNKVDTTKNVEDEVGDLFESKEIENEPYIVRCKNIDFEEVLSDIMGVEKDNKTLKVEEYKNLFKIAENSRNQLAYAISLDFNKTKEKVRIYSEVINKEPDNKLAHWNLLM